MISTDTAPALRALRSIQGLADCRRRQVAAVVCLPDGTVVGSGWNGLPGESSCYGGDCPRGLMSYSEQPKDLGYAETGCRAIHAEDAALQNAGLLAQGSVVFVTEKPCPGCAALLRESQVSAVFHVSLQEGTILLLDE